jgi:5'-nucleotidase
LGAATSRVLFNLDDLHKIFETQVKEAFHRYEIEHEDEIFAHLRDIFLQLAFISICYNSTC